MRDPTWFAVVFLLAAGSALADEPRAPTPAATPAPAAPARPASAAFLDAAGLVPGMCFHSNKVHQVACVNAFAEEGEARWHSLEFFTFGGDAVRSLALDDAGRAPNRQDPGRLARPNELLASNGFERSAGELVDRGGASEADVPGLGVRAEVRDEVLLLTPPKGGRALRVRLPVRRPDTARLSVLVVVPGTRLLAVTLVVTPASGHNESWTSLLIKVP